MKKIKPWEGILGRRGFAPWFLVTVLFPLISFTSIVFIDLLLARREHLTGVASPFQPYMIVLFGVALLVSIVLAVFLIFATIRRLRDIGWSPWWTLVYVVPVISYVFPFILMAKPSKTMSMAEQSTLGSV